MMAKKGAKMVLFEPSPTMWPRIKANFDRNKLKPFLTFAGFASDKSPESPEQGADFELGEKNGWPLCAYGDETNVRSFRHLSEQAVATPQITIDDFCTQHNIIPNLITIDVEGSELEVLEGARKVLTEVNPLIYISIHENLMWLNYGHWFHDLYWSYLREMNYKPYFLAHNHETHWLFRKGI
jgi:FkbM family methyltransferase